MTRDEAIAFFKDMNECTYGNLEAVEMAIKALEQEPCEDCISRQATLDLCERFNGCVPYSVLSSYDALPSVTPPPKTEALDKIRAEIEQIIGERNLDDYDFCSGLICARNIIDKYNAKPKDIKARDIEMQATEFLAEARLCAERNNNPERR